MTDLLSAAPEDPREPMSFRDIKQVVLDRIESRVWPPDSLLPSEKDLAEEFSSTRTTVNRALRELAEEGYLERRRKAGTRVLNAPVRQARLAIPLVRDEVVAMGASYRYVLVGREELAAPGWLAARFGLPPQARVLHVRCMHFADARPFQFEDRWIVTDSVPGVLEADFSAIGPNEWLLQRVPVSNVELTFSASRAGAEMAEFLDAAPGDPIFTVERMTWLRGAPVTFARLYHVPGYGLTTRI
ncbi:UTRA domain-containing protein [Pseudodonghicola flavimaris]|uniref:UTRA domain-containing protein n=1 Tax=Pseudodonghicola flavimaris TaxID=3050036 RepID=A0ABT7F2T4_9RHOB|nr:UTRA domain-containing protein [Pseudodonghicola flavimaris]MDK3018916.1 UTRA domain-containing protein [Pseudodonghicola flavimaris]